MSGLVWPVARSAQDCFLLKHLRVEGAHGESLGAGYLTVWDSQTDEKCHIWAEFTKCLRAGKKWSHLLFLLWSRLPPTPSLESLPQIAFTQAFITQLKLSYCSWHSERATTSAKTIHLSLFIQKNLWKSEQSNLQMAQMAMCYLNVDNRLCVAGINLWKAVTPKL